MKRLPTLLFDWDGVVVDSNAWKWGGAWEQVFKKEPELYGLMQEVLAGDPEKRLTRQQLVDETLARASAQGHEPIGTAGEYVQSFGEAVRNGTLRVGLFSDAKDVLHRLHDAGHRMHVISMTAQEDLDHAANILNVGHYFISLNGRPGTKEEHAETIRDTEEGEAYVVIGDGAGDRDLAAHLGVPFIGVVNEWNGWSADDSLVYKVSGIGEVPDILKRL